MHTCVLARLTHTALQKTAVCNFGVCTWASEHMTCTRDTHHKFPFYVPHYMCGAATGTVALGNEMQLFCSWLASWYVVISRGVALLNISGYPYVVST